MAREVADRSVHRPSRLPEPTRNQIRFLRLAQSQRDVRFTSSQIHRLVARDELDPNPRVACVERREPRHQEPSGKAVRRSNAHLARGLRVLAKQLSLDGEGLSLELLDTATHGFPGS